MLPDNLFNHLTLKQTFQRSLSVFWARWYVFLLLTTLTIPTLIVLVFVTFGNLFIDDPNITAKSVIFLRVLWVLAILLHLSVDFVVRGARVITTARIYTGHAPRCFEAIGQALKQCGSLLCVALLLGSFTTFLSIILGVTLAVTIDKGNRIWIVVAAVLITILAPLIVFVLVSMTSVIPLIVVENQSAFDSIRRSWDLATGSRGYIFVALLLFMLIDCGCKTLLHLIPIASYLLDFIFIPLFDM